MSSRKKSLINGSKSVKKAKTEAKKPGKAILSARGISAKSAHNFRLGANYNQALL